MFKTRQNSNLRKLLNKELNNNVADIHRYIADLKELNCGILRTMGELCKKLKIDLSESRELVLNSPSWINEKEKFIESNNNAWQLLEQAADEVEENEDGTISLTFDLTKDDEK